MVKDVGARIAEIRRKRGIKQDELAEMAMLSRISIARYESGKMEPGALALSRIADVLEVTTDELLGRVDAKQDSPEEDERWIISEQIRRDPNLRILFSQARSAKPNAILAATAVLETLKGTKDD